MLKAIRSVAVTILTVSLILFTLIAILAIWDVFSEDTAWKALSTLGVIFFASLIAMVIVRFADEKTWRSGQSSKAGQ